jgi:hypothetical protein
MMHLTLITAVCKSTAVAHPTSFVLIISVSSAFRTVPPNDRGKNRIAPETEAGMYSDKKRIATGTDSAKSKIIAGIDSGKNKIADSTENKENEMRLTKSKGMKKQIENQATGTKREINFSSRHEKEKDLSEDFSNNEENGEDQCQEQEEVPPISVSDVEIQLKNVEMTDCETKNIEGQMKKLAISVPEGELCECSPMLNEKRHINNYSQYAVSSPICFSAF